MGENSFSAVIVKPFVVMERRTTVVCMGSAVKVRSGSTSLLYLSRFFLVSTFYKVDFCTLLSTCNEVTFSGKYLLSTSLLLLANVSLPK